MLLFSEDDMSGQPWKELHVVNRNGKAFVYLVIDYESRYSNLRGKRSAKAAYIPKSEKFTLEL